MTISLYKKAINRIKNDSISITNVLISMIPQIIGFFTGIVSSILITRGLGPAELGKFALIMSISEAVTVLTDIGINQTALRYSSLVVSRGDHDRHLSILRWVFRVRICIAFLLNAIIFFLSSLLAEEVWHNLDLIFPIRLSLFINILNIISTIPALYFQSKSNFKMNSLIIAVQKIIYFIGIIFVFITGIWRINFLLISVIISTALSASIFAFIIPKSAYIKREDSMLDFRIPKVGDVQKRTSENPNEFAFFMMISTIIILLSTKADFWLIGNLLDTTQVGLYSASMRFPLPLIIILSSINVVLWPKVSTVTDRAHVDRIMVKTLKWSLLIAGFGLLYSIFVPLLAPFLFGQEYSSIVLLSQLQCIRYVVALVASPLGVIGYSMGLIKHYWLINTVQLLIILCLNIFLLPVHGIVVSAISLILSELFGLFALLFIIKKRVAASG